MQLVLTESARECIDNRYAEMRSRQDEQTLPVTARLSANRGRTFPQKDSSFLRLREVKFHSHQSVVFFVENTLTRMGQTWLLGPHSAEGGKGQERLLQAAQT